MGLLESIFALFFSLTSFFVQSQNWAQHSVLDRNGTYHLYWNPPSDNRGDSEITFKVEVKAKGYWGLGFSPNGGMPGSDIVTGWIKDGEVYFQDRYADAFSLPMKDEQQDYELINAYENDTFTVFEFKRKLDTCDEKDWVINESTMRVIYAYSNEDPKSGDPFYHRQNRGVKSMFLLQNQNTEDIDIDLTSLSTWDVAAPDVDISSIDTLYWCKIVKTPEVSEKNHIIYVKPLIQEGNEKYVHHIIMYECGGATPEVYEEFIDQKGHPCNTPDMPEPMKACEGVTIAWAVGGKDMVLPEKAGIPIYPAPGKYYSLEVHYDNPQRQSGIVDHSGFRFYYTPDLREYDAGVFLMGSTVVPRIIIPPGQEDYVVVGHTNYDCIGSEIPDNGVKGFAIALHTHLAGRAIKVRHFRGNTELPPLAIDNYYDFNYQAYQFYSKEIDLLPHDQVSVECTYDSSERNEVTVGGSKTTQEMCMAFLMYYPLVNQYGSVSMPTFDNINKVLNTNITRDSEVYNVLRNYDWGNVDIGEFENAMRYSEHNTRCYSWNGQVDLETMVSYPSDLIPYVPEKSTCNTTDEYYNVPD